LDPQNLSDASPETGTETLRPPNLVQRDLTEHSPKSQVESDMLGKKFPLKKTPETIKSYDDNPEKLEDFLVSAEAFVYAHDYPVKLLE
jgi:hypothetical protein